MLATIFGDLARDPDDQVDGPVLTRITAAMELKPEAVRVALHRLRNDGWIKSEKSGRTASYALTPFGRAQSQSASMRIYAPPLPADSGWCLALTESTDPKIDAEMEEAGFVQVLPRVFCASAGRAAPEGAILFPGGAVPRWLRAQITPPDLTAAYMELSAALDQLTSDLRRHPSQTLLERAVLRCLIVHNWRRLILRHPDLPPSLTGTQWPGHQCRAKVTALLDRLPRPPLRALSAELR